MAIKAGSDAILPSENRRYAQVSSIINVEWKMCRRCAPQHANKGRVKDQLQCQFDQLQAHRLVNL